MIIAALVLFMSGWFLKDLKDNNRWLLVERGLDGNARAKPLMDSLRQDGYEIRSLSPGFPLAPPAPPAPALMPGQEGQEMEEDYASRLEELSILPLDSIVIVASNRASGFRGDRIALPPNVRWITLDPAPTEFEVRKVRLHTDSVIIRKGKSSAEQTSFESMKMRSVGTLDSSQQMVSVQIVYDDAFESDQRVLTAVLNAVKSSTPDILFVRSISTAKYHNKMKFDWIFWLSESEPPSIDGRVVLFRENIGMPLLSQNGPTDFLLTSRLNSEIVVKANLAVRLMLEFFPSKEARNLAAASDVRSVDEQMMWSRKATELKSVIETGNEKSEWYLMGLLLILIVSERVVSYQRLQ
jgi:hypothetical protein